MEDILSVALEQYCYLTTRGRKTGKPHTIEIWFAAGPSGSTIYMLSGNRDRSDWVKNLERDRAVDVRIDGRTFEGSGRVVTGEEEAGLARRLVVAKYYGREEVATSGWEAESLPVAIDLNM